MKKSVLYIENLPAERTALGPVDTVDLNWEQRCKPRQRVVTAGGAELALSLPRGTQLIEGMLLYNATDATIAVRARPEPLVAIKPDGTQQACRIAHHLGNWHRSCQVEDGIIYAQPDSPLEQWLQKQNISYEHCHRPFTPDLRSHSHD